VVGQPATIPIALAAALLLVAGVGHAQPVPSGGGGLAAASPFAQHLLAAHNAARARVGVTPLVWSDRLAAYAQGWADRLVASGGFAHRPDNRYGENLYEVRGVSAEPRDVVDAWVSEASNYRPAGNACSAVCGHYTQIVWRETRAVGCGVAGDYRREVWVCDYDPPGNVIGRRPY
jgi:pathogenesis-related protein 1